MAKNITPTVNGLQRTQEAIDVLSDIDLGERDTEIISALRDLRNARSRIAEVLRKQTRWGGE